MRRRLIFVVSVFIIAITSFVLAGCGSDSPTDPENGDPAVQTVWYVDADAMGTGDGKSWDNAFDHPVDAMTAASSGNQIWVAEGTYYGPGDRTDPVVAFKAGVAVYGGFVGGETNLSQRNWISNIAVFVGADTLFHVITGADDALLHGCSVTGGNAAGTGSTSEMRGGGIYCYEAKMRISNCRINNNTAGIGGGIYAEHDTIVVDSCTIDENNATDTGYDYSGGGGINIISATATILHCSIDQNESAKLGGGLLLYNSMATVSSTELTLNRTAGSSNNGGGMYVSNFGSQAIKPEFIDCRFASNTGGYGGAAFLHYSSPYFSDCEFESNTGTMTGAAVNTAHSSYLMENCIIDSSDGAAIYNYYPLGANSPRIFNCLFSRNDGAIINNTVDTEIEFCTFVYNTASNGGGIYSSGTCSPEVTNCILWFNTASAAGDQIHDVSGATSIVTYTDIDQDGFDGGTGNIRSDPLFVTGPRGDFYLGHVAAGQGADSPCIDIGSHTAISYLLHIMTTRTDSAVDAGQADLGFHYEPDN